MVEAGGGESDSPWDAEAAEALARIYEAEAVAAPHAPAQARQPAPRPAVQAAAAVAMAMPVPTAEPGAHWLEDRFAEIASKVERSLAELQPERSMELLSGRFDDFESRMSAVLHEVAARTDLDSLRLIEAHIEELARHAEETNTQFTRLGEIEGQLATVVDRLTRIERSECGFDEARFGADLQALIDASVEQAAERLAGAGDGEARGHRLDDLRGLIVAFMDDRRRGDEETTIALETMQEAMIRVLDKVEALELVHGGARLPYSEAGETPLAAVSAMSSSNLAGPVPELSIGEPLGGVADEIVAHPAPVIDQAGPHHVAEWAMRAEPPSLLATAEETAATRDTLAQEQGTPAGRTIDRMRQDLIAEARRAKQQADAAAAAEPQKAARTAKPTDRRKAVISEEKPAGKRAISRNTMVAAVLLLLAVPALVVAVPRLAKRTSEPAATTRTLQQKAAPAGASGDQKGEPTTADPARRSDTQEPARSTAPSQFGALPDSVPGIMFANADKSLSDEQIRRAYEQHALAEHSSRLAGSATNVTPAALTVETPPTASATVPATGAAAGKLELPPASVGPLSLRTAAANGDPSAQFEVGARLAEGKGIDQNFTEAARWYQRAASQGFAQAQYRLATLYERGLGMKKDLARARNWYQRAAEAGNVKAMHNLAVLSAGRAGEAPDYQTASRWFERAATLGLADSQYNLAVLFENGLGVAQDKKRAYQWYALAAR
ncbi:MAG: hypothetical protein AB1749_17555, partial [Pseudomonadota bacterium]